MEYGLSLGSNLGDRLQHLRAAASGIVRFCGAEIVARSRVYETEPVGVAPAYAQLPFLNAVLVVRGDPDPAELAVELHGIEWEAGRVRTADRYAPRPLDIDVLYADDVQLSTEVLTLPHPRWAERRFVVQPLADVRPDLRLPGETRTVREVLASLPPAPKVVLFAESW